MGTRGWLRPDLRRVALPTDDAGLADRMDGRGHWLWVGGPLPRGADGLTLGSLVIVRRRAASISSRFDELLRHEQVHVAQFRELGTMRFLLRYVGSYARLRVRGYGHHGSYRRIPLEIEARFVAAISGLGAPAGAPEHGDVAAHRR